MMVDIRLVDMEENESSLDVDAFKDGVVGDESPGIH